MITSRCLVFTCGWSWCTFCGYCSWWLILILGPLFCYRPLDLLGRRSLNPAAMRRRPAEIPQSPSRPPARVHLASCILQSGTFSLGAFGGTWTAFLLAVGGCISHDLRRSQPRTATAQNNTMPGKELMLSIAKLPPFTSHIASECFRHPRPYAVPMTPIPLNIHVTTVFWLAMGRLQEILIGVSNPATNQ